MKQKKGNADAKDEARELLRSQVIERLKRNLEGLASYCHSDDDRSWPSRKLLQEIQGDVNLLLKRVRPVRPVWPIWEAFQKVDKRFKKLRLKSRVNDLIRRARNILRSESDLSKAVKAALTGSAVAQCAWREMVLQPEKFVKLLLDDRRMVTTWCLAKPLMNWAITIRHPVVEELKRVRKFLPTVEEVKASDRRAKAAERTRKSRFRKKNSSKSVTST